MPKSNKQKIFFLIFLLFLGLSFFSLGNFLISPRVVNIESSLAQVSQNTKSSAPEEKTIKIIFVGDVMLDRGVEYQILKQNNWKWPFMKVAEKLKEADIVFGNLESPISDKGKKAGSIYSFRADPRAIQSLSYAGFNVMSIANNHAFDYTREALEDTFLRLKEAKIDYVGGGFNATEAGSPVIKKIDGTKIAFLAYTNLCPPSWRATKDKSGINCVSLNDLEKIKNTVIDAKKQSDIVVVSMHAGEEYTQELNQFQTEFSKAVAESGADIVIGHHPHVVQKYETEQLGGENKWIFYSLGNFIFDQSFSTSTMTGQIIKVTVENKKITKVKEEQTTINAEFQPEIND